MTRIRRPREPRSGLRESPFAVGKWELEPTRHYYYLKSNDYLRLSTTSKHCFVIGHRGTGKTTLLRALDWSERLNNNHLSDELNNEPFSDGVIGCYFNFRAMGLPVIETWTASSESAIRHVLLASYLSALWLEEAALATRKVASTFENFELSTERRVLGPLVDRLEAWLPDSLETSWNPRHDEAISLSQIRQIFGRLRDYLWSAATLGVEAPEVVASKLRLNRLQDLTNASFNLFSVLLGQLAPTLPWTFRICMDEGEYLSTSASLTVRTLVRQCDSPLIIVVADLSDIGIDTLFNRVQLTNDDRYLLNLESRSATAMRELVDGIVRARLRASIYTRRSFSIERLLGRPDLNDLLFAVASENNDFGAFITRWREISDDRASWRHEARGRSPIRDYLTYTNSISEDDPPTRAQDSAGYRKKKVAGYLHLLNQFGIDRPVYAGVDIAISMGDNSVRNVLMFLEETRLAWCAYRRVTDTLSDRAVSGFIAVEGVPVRFQDKGLERLGEVRLANLDDRVIHFTAHARRLIELFGRLSHIVDFGRPGEIISLPDQRRFKVRLPGPMAAGLSSRVELDRLPEHSLTARFIAILRECHEEGFLRIVRLDPELNEATFEVSSSLARYFGFGYHTASYTRWIEWEPIRSALEDDNLRSIENLAQRAASSRRPDRLQARRINRLASGQLEISEENNPPRRS